MARANNFMRVRVTTINLATKELYSERVIDFKLNKHREWLDKHQYWCFNNGYGVAMNNVVDDEGTGHNDNQASAATAVA